MHSPLVGPVTWELVAAALTSRGLRTTVPDLTPTVIAGPPYMARLAEVMAAAASGSPSPVLIGHSGAGPLLAAAGSMLDSVAGYVFVDAGLPTPGQTWLNSMPADLAADLRSMAGDDGRLPPWPRWWGDHVVAEMLPDLEVRTRFIAECRPLPVAMFEEAMPEAVRWPDAPAAYLRLSEGYDEQADQARALGWPVTDLDSHHLAALTDPNGVANALLDLLGRLGPVR